MDRAGGRVKEKDRGTQLMQQPESFNSIPGARDGTSEEAPFDIPKVDEGVARPRIVINVMSLIC